MYNVLNFALDFQVNHSPSFTTDSPLDKEIKEGLMFDALNLLNFGACDRRKILEEDKKRVRDRLLQKQRPKEAKYVHPFLYKSQHPYHHWYCCGFIPHICSILISRSNNLLLSYRYRYCYRYRYRFCRCPCSCISLYALQVCGTRYSLQIYSFDMILTSHLVNILLSTTTNELYC